MKSLVMAFALTLTSGVFAQEEPGNSRLSIVAVDGMHYVNVPSPIEEVPYGDYLYWHKCKVTLNGNVVNTYDSIQQEPNDETFYVSGKMGQYRVECKWTGSVLKKP